jgi:molecular chaperone GrpE
MAKRKKHETATVLDEHTAEAETTQEPEVITGQDVVDSEAVVEGSAAGDQVAAEPAKEEAAPAAELAAQFEQAQQEAAEYKENWLRAAAELANFKRRQEEQLKLQRDMIKSDVIQGVLSALDDMDLAFQNVPEQLNGQLIGWVEGFRLVQRKLDRVLEEQSVTLINTEGKFDPNFHEAVSYEESPDHEEGDIIGEVRKGYRIGNRVLRPALVRVAKSTGA